MPNLHPRQYLSQPELIALLNWELAAYDECSGCHFTAVELAPLAAGSECNWTGAAVEDAGAGDARKQRITAQVLAETREQFNVRAPALLPRQIA